MEQSRKKFLKTFLIGSGAGTAAVAACKKDTLAQTDTGACAVTDSETDGPYPLYESRGSEIQRVDMTGGKTGLPLNMIITIRDVNHNCETVADARVDLWHCDKDGYYSGYSNNGYLGTQNNSSENFCRGIQYTNARGEANFTTIYPGWYQGRVTHIHAQVYVNDTLKLTTQIAFPDTINTTVYNTELYKAHGQSPLTNARDNIISDSLDNELATVTENASTGGYSLIHTIYIRS